MNRVLFVDDEVQMLNAIKRALRKQFEIEIAVGGAKALELIEVSDPFRVVVSDMQMPGMNGIEFLRHVKERSPDTVRIMMTGDADQRTAVNAVNQGDIFRFLQKPCDPDELVRAISDAVDQAECREQEKERVIQAVNEVEAISTELSNQYKYDKLTGLLNRAEFERHIEEAVRSTNDHEDVHSLCFIDLDRFITINDTCGHTAGDEFLLQIIKVFEEGIRKRDSLARLGGDEFGILLKGCPADQAIQIVTRIREAVAAHRFVWEEKSFSVTCSMGLVQIPEGAEDARSLMHLGDNLCALAKEAGRDRVHVYDPEDKELREHSSLAQWTTRISQAMDENRFQLFFQHIVPVDVNQVEGEHYEFLIRMVDEDGAIIPPGLFLPAAEKYDQSVKIDRWVIDKALTWLSEHPEHTSRLHLCGINLSGPSMSDEFMLAHICGRLKECPGLAEKLCFEVTETAAIANLNQAINFIQVLQEKGCQFALDDFGSGLSSFSYLKNLPVDYLKIDGSFVKEIHKNHIDYAMVKSINEIGHVMGKQTIAEFVEDSMVLGKLREIGVDYAQGYHINKPQPMEDLLILPVVANKLAK